MTEFTLTSLAALIRQESDVLMKAWRLEVRGIEAAAGLDMPTLNDHIPELLEEMACELELCSHDTMVTELKKNSVTHGLDRLRLGFDIEEVVAEYNALRGVIYEMIERHGLSLRGTINRTINRVIDMSIGVAVKTYATQKALELQQRREEHLAFVAHDLRSPLACIGVAAKMLESANEELASDETAATLLHAVHRNVDRLNGLVMQVVQSEMNLAARQDGSIERHPVPLFEFTEQLLHDLQPLALTTRITLHNEVPTTLRAYADRNMLGLILQNLLSNAISYAPYGTVTIGAKATDTPGGVQCWVTDNGCGISADRLDKVFQKLVTDPERSTGLGLGLAIVQDFVQAHGGEVWVESKVGEGSSFFFSLPGETRGKAA